MVIIQGSHHYNGKTILIPQIYCSYKKYVPPNFGNNHKKSPLKNHCHVVHLFLDLVSNLKNKNIDSYLKTPSAACEKHHCALLLSLPKLVNQFQSFTVLAKVYLVVQEAQAIHDGLSKDDKDAYMS
jgi:hypothetical protein